MPGTLLIRHQVVQMRQAGEKCLLAHTGMLEPLHREQRPLDEVRYTTRENGVQSAVSDRSRRGTVSLGARHHLLYSLAGVRAIPGQPKARPYGNHTAISSTRQQISMNS